MFEDPMWNLLAIVVAIALASWLLARDWATTTSRSPRARRGKTEATLPSNRGALTQHLKQHYSAIEAVKRGSSREDLSVLGKQICSVGLTTEQMTASEKFAAIFLVNRLFHQGYSGAAEKKNFFQRTLVLYHRHEITVRLVSSGKYDGTYEISLGIWSTHVPRSVVEDGGLDRPGRPSARSALRRPPPTKRW